MILKAFRIKNYRSIIDTGWNHLSSDNVTSLIGQNESGKTSVLEALKSFYDGVITDDMLRSDLQMPEVTCLFEIEQDFEYPNQPESFPMGVVEAINESGSVVLTRKWDDLQSSRLLLNGEDIINLYKDFDNFWVDLDREITEAHNTFLEKRKGLTEQANSLKQLIIKYNSSIESLNLRKDDIQRKARKLSDERLKEAGEKESTQIETEILKIDNQRENKTAELSKVQEEINSLSAFLSISSNSTELKTQADKTFKDVDHVYKELVELESKLQNLRSRTEHKNTHKKIEQLKSFYIQLTGNCDHLKNEIKLMQLELRYRLYDKDEFEAKHLAERDYNYFEKILSREEAALLFHENLPHFELFEDFSSLLPNKIDLEDLFTENTSAEGYKAVKNFLVIAGLQPDFFTQTNNRILKQKIENLNNELTVNFQDYWGQCIGKANKIQIAFELEHYDFRNPEKMGKPYLEFWIKDELERLYPKQRSRGVRWFLSFYLELKASAMKHRNKSRILLIDEPGLSLHSRAQEDVLKVFDDIKDKLQIVYTTHSPNLIDLSKLFRILAVQRSHEKSKSQTVIFEPSALHAAAQDTLSPIYSLMGVRLSEHEFISQKNNILVEDTATYYYLSAMLPIAGFNKQASFLPATGSQTLPLLSNLMLGWGLDYRIIVFGQSLGKKEIDELIITLGPEEKGNILRVENATLVEDLFSTLDFKKHIIKQRVGIPELNSDYIKDNNLSRVMLASTFAQLIKSKSLSFNDLDEETKENFKELEKKLRSIIP